LAIINPTTVWFVAKFYITFSLTILGNESSRDGTFQGEKVLRSEKAGTNSSTHFRFISQPGMHMISRTQRPLRHPPMLEVIKVWHNLQHNTK